MHFSKIIATLATLCLVEATKNFREEFHACLNAIFEEYFRAKSMLIYDTRPVDTSDERRQLHPHKTHITADEIIQISQRNKLKTVAVHNLKFQQSEKKYNLFKPQSSVFLMTEAQTIEWQKTDALFLHIKESEYWNRQSKTLIIIQNFNETLNMAEMAKNALVGNWRWNKAVNVTVMVLRKDKFYFFFWIPFKYPDCRQITDRPVNEIWSNGTFQNKIDLYPKKIFPNLEGCEMRIVTSPCVPYTYQDAGFEENVVLTLQKHFNFTRTLVDIPEGQSLWTTRSENGSAVGAFGLLSQQKADLAYGCLMLTKERYQLSEALPCFYHDSLSWFVPAPDERSHASNIYAVFSGAWWLTIVLTTISCIFTVYLIVKLEEFALIRTHPKNFIAVSLRIFAMAISSPIALPSRTVLLRIFTFAFAVYSLHITTTYQASLYKLYRSHSYEKSYKTIEDVVDSNLLIWLRSSNKNLYNQSDHSLWEKILRPDKHKFLSPNPIPAFDEVALDKTAAVLYVKTTMEVYIQILYLNDDTRVPQIMEIPQQFTAYPATIYLSPGHPLFRLFSEKMEHLVASGLIEYWLKLQVGQFAKKFQQGIATQVSLSLEHMGGALLFQGVMAMLASIVFLFEFAIWHVNGKTVGSPVRREELNRKRSAVLKTTLQSFQKKIHSEPFPSEEPNSTNNKLLRVQNVG